ncbi:unnamed protein product [Effrenium voratum]|uniref:Uncharacterized protein n=1 Tax=Effrenium voratum TaxID=2562239 RepID=A0AA36IUQ7_9DINO|nr:unnamed protein product [Effrenium voratum]CAJ1434764.1 unnamed protein product [Effrenium voratum]
MGRLSGSFFANLLGMGNEKRTLSEDDFVKWFSTLKPPQPTLVGEALPPGVPTMASRYGVFGGKALITGVPGDENYNPNPCIEAEARPAAPCEATGECQDLAELATRFEHGSQIAHAAALNAINAMQAAQVLLRRVDKAAENLTLQPELSHQSASEPNGPGGYPWSLDDQLMLTIRGPIMHDNPSQDYDLDHDFLARKMAQWDYEHRVVEYLQKTEGNRPLQLIENLGRMPIIEPMPTPTPIQPFKVTLNPTIQNPVAPVAVAAMPLSLCTAFLLQIGERSIDRRRRSYKEFLQ